MTECLPDLPRYIRQRGDEWQGADHPDGPWRPIPAPQSGLPWQTDGPAVSENREPASVTADARPLSPAAQAAVEAFGDRYELLGPLEDDWQEQCLAVALLAIALYLDNDCQQLLAIADELEGQP